MTNPHVHIVSLTHEQATRYIDTLVRAWDALPPGELKDSVHEFHAHLDTLIPIHPNEPDDPSKRNR